MWELNIILLLSVLSTGDLTLYSLIVRVGLVKDIRLTLHKRKFLMIHTMRMVLHYSASRALDQTICKPYKLNPYALISLCICLYAHFVLGNNTQCTNFIVIDVFFFIFLCQPGCIFLEFLLLLHTS